jgi:hypothetical protein
LRIFSTTSGVPAILLLGALVIAAVFFALGIMPGRWVADDKDAHGSRPQATVNQTQDVLFAPSRRP